jgi:hypothetical protein
MKGSYNDIKFRLKLFVYTKMLSFKLDYFFHKPPTKKNKTLYTDLSHDVVLFFSYWNSYVTFMERQRVSVLK